MKRRSFLQGAAAGGAIGVLDWLGFFRSFGVPGTSKSLGIARAVAQTMEPKFLVMWFREGGWDSYSMLAPIDIPEPVKKSATMAPTSASGSAIMIVTGWMNDSNCDASTR